MTPATSVLDLPEDLFRKQVYDVISRELGLAGYARFLMTFCSGRGDYTAERQQNPDRRTLDEIWQELESQGLTQKP